MERRKSMLLSIIVGGIVLFLLSSVAIIVFLISMYRTARLDRVLEQDLFFAQLPKSFEGFSVFFIADLHRRVISDQLIEVVRNRVDLVIIGGDIVESGVPLSVVEENLTKLKELGSLYFVWGNNDYEVDIAELEALLLKYQVTILANTAVTLQSKKGEKLTLLGIDDIAVARDRLDVALAACHEKSFFRVLVSHNPKVKKQLLAEHRISLVLSGHTHGGQVRIFGYGPYQLGSIEIDDGCTYVTSNGYGTSTVPLRWGAKPEAHLFTFKQGRQSSVGEQKEIRL